MKRAIENRRRFKRWAGIAVLGVVGLVGCAGPDRAVRAETSASSGQIEPEEHSAVVLAVRTPRHMKVALLTARQMLSGEGGFRANAVDVIACGDAVPALVAGEELSDQVRETQALGARVVACGLTIEQKGLDPASLLDGVEVVPNGLTEIVRLQAQGYHSVEL